MEPIEDCDCDSLRVEIHFQLGQINYLIGNYTEAQKNYLISLNIAENENYSDVLFDLYSWLGLLHKTIENYKDAERYYKLSLNYSDTTANNYSTALSYYNLGTLYENRGNFKKAKSYFKKAVAICVKLEAYPLLASYYNLIGECELNEKNYDLAYGYFKRSRKALKNIDPSNRLAINFYTIIVDFSFGEYYYETGDHQTALVYFSKARDLAIGKSHYYLARRILKNLANTYEQLGDFKEAVYFLKRYELFNDSLYSANILVNLTRLELEYRHLAEIKNKQIKRLKSESEYKQRVQKYRLLALTGSLFTLILILLLMLFRSKQREKLRLVKFEKQNLTKEKESLSKEIELKKRELTTSVIYLLKKNNFQHDIMEKLMTAIKVNKHQELKNYQDIVKELNNSLGKDAWDEFELRFNEVHNSFNEKLLHDFPDLTPNDLKVCAFLRLNMTTKDISTITFQSANTISVARHRLRLKLNLDRDENLVTFLAKY